MTKPAIGAQLYTLKEYEKTLPDIVATLKKVAAIGYTTVQVSGFGPADPKDVARAAGDAGLRIVSTHTSWTRFLNELDQVIAEHKLWKCFHPAIGGLPKDYFCAEGVKRFLDELGPIAEKLKNAGMDFSYHNHNHELAKYGRKTWLASICDESDPSVLKAEIDTYWIAAGGGDPADWIKRWAGRIPLLHCKDMIATKEREQRFAEVGEGNLNWDAILNQAEKSGVEYLLVEQDNCYGRDPFESLAISYNNLASWGYK
ncbi:MAG: sugar phosphate isomerase/epimerase [Kiritimatiellae bacterium]|nr:sugar phosphate isomerase/epimerase [Kiritimatiellia bacterium]